MVALTSNKLQGSFVSVSSSFSSEERRASSRYALPSLRRRVCRPLESRIALQDAISMVGSFSPCKSSEVFTKATTACAIIWLQVSERDMVDEERNRVERCPVGQISGVAGGICKRIGFGLCRKAYPAGPTKSKNVKASHYYDHIHVESTATGNHHPCSWVLACLELLCVYRPGVSMKDKRAELRLAPSRPPLSFWTFLIYQLILQ